MQNLVFLSLLSVAPLIKGKGSRESFRCQMRLFLGTQWYWNQTKAKQRQADLFVAIPVMFLLISFV